MRSMIWSGVLVHLKGRACSFQSLIQSSSAVVSSSSEQNTPRSRHRRCNSASHCAVLRRLTQFSNVRRSSPVSTRSEEHTSELQSHLNLVCRLLLEKKNETNVTHTRCQ